MTVKDLIEHLSKLPPDAPVYVGDHFDAEPLQTGRLNIWTSELADEPHAFIWSVEP